MISRALSAPARTRFAKQCRRPKNLQVEISPSYFGVKPEDLNVHAAAARQDTRPMPAKPVGHVRGHTMQGANKAPKVSVDFELEAEHLLLMSCFPLLRQMTDVMVPLRCPLLPQLPGMVCGPDLTPHATPCPSPRNCHCYVALFSRTASLRSQPWGLRTTLPRRCWRRRATGRSATGGPSG